MAFLSVSGDLPPSDPACFEVGVGPFRRRRQTCTATSITAKAPTTTQGTVGEPTVPTVPQLEPSPELRKMVMVAVPAVPLVPPELSVPPELAVPTELAVPLELAAPPELRPEPAQSYGSSGPRARGTATAQAENGAGR